MHFANGRRAFFGWWTVPEGGSAWFSNLPHKELMTPAQAREVAGRRVAGAAARAARR